MKLADVLHPAVEALWCCAFFAVGRVVPKRVGLWAPSGGERILIVSPHPDDESMSCAGTILLHALAGDAVCIACITDGSRSRAGGLNSRQMGEQRRKEALAAADALRAVRLEWLGLAEGGWTAAELHSQLLPILRQFSPHVIYAPSRVDFHPEHRNVAHGLAQLLMSEGRALPGVTLRVYQTQVPLTPVLANQVVDCSSVWPEAVAALHAYASQSANFGRAVRLRRYTAMLYGLGRYCEEYWQMPAADYCRLHATAPDAWDTDRFRGIRYRPFSDPLAYLWGLNARRHLRRSLGGRVT